MYIPDLAFLSHLQHKQLIVLLVASYDYSLVHLLRINIHLWEKNCIKEIKLSKRRLQRVIIAGLWLIIGLKV